MSRSSYATSPYRLDDTQDELRQTGMCVTFLNPETAQIGVAASSWRDEACLATEREFDRAVGPLLVAQVRENLSVARRVSEFGPPTSSSTPRPK